MKENTFHYDIFLSFASVDEEEAKEIWSQLTDSGFRVFWSDESLKQNIGTSFFTVVQDALTKSEHFLLLFTTNSSDSNWVQEEYETFFSHCYLPSNRKRRLLILLNDESLKTTIPPFLKNIQTTSSLITIIETLGGSDLERLRTENSNLRNKLQELEGKYSALLLNQENAAKNFSNNARNGKAIDTNRSISGSVSKDETKQGGLGNPMAWIAWIAFFVALPLFLILAT